MAPVYPINFNIRLSHKDRNQLNDISIKSDIPASTLARKILRQWMRSNDGSFNDGINSLKKQNPPSA